MRKAQVIFLGLCMAQWSTIAISTPLARLRLPSATRRRVDRITPLGSDCYQNILRFRGGADAVAKPISENHSDDSVLQKQHDESEGSLSMPRDDDQKQPTCWAAFKRILEGIISLFSPSYDYAKVKTDVLGDSSQTSGFSPEDESWRSQRKKLNVVELPPPVRKRVLRDLRRLKQDADVDLGFSIDDCECLTDWVVKLVGAPGTVYDGEIYRLRIRFHADYPMAPPEVTFMRPAPVHEHIYSDGKICLNILYSGWKPDLDVRAICLSLRSMLSSATKKSRPPDNNSTVVMSRGQKTREMQWEFHDDKC
mmetsp:Transcript_28770/g.60488  ORF Transcript_28770/g.60488 Transcript_28770/m.60488 type:complete len:308 (-) Transcript_28770:279-1202(-)